MKRAAALIFAIIIFTFALAPTALGEDVIDKVFFFGDSTTAHLAVRGGIPRERVWSGAGNTMLFSSVLDRSVKIKDEFFTLAEAVGRYRPRFLVITVGASGGAGFIGEKNFKLIYANLIRSVRRASAETNVLVQSILPLSDKSVKYYKKLTRQAIERANGWIREVCEEENVGYIDTYSVIVGENGYLPDEYQNDEYLHLTAAAYKAIIGNIRSYITEHIEEYN